LQNIKKSRKVLTSRLTKLLVKELNESAFFSVPLWPALEKFTKNYINPKLIHDQIFLQIERSLHKSPDSNSDQNDNLLDLNV
jgi:hypothetical protein